MKKIEKIRDFFIYKLFLILKLAKIRAKNEYFWPKVVSYRGEHVFWFLYQKFSKSAKPILKKWFLYLKSAFWCNFEAKYQPNQRNYS